MALKLVYLVNKNKIISDKEIINEILFKIWDPIGLENEIDFSNEYDSYAGQLLGMIYRKESQENLVNFLNNVELNFMGLKPSFEKNKIVISKILKKIK